MATSRRGRSGIAACSTPAIVLAVVDIGMLIGFGPSSQDALVFFLVLGACAWIVVRMWRLEHQY